eukprot:2696090-Pyramimonas_sp.AAC.1
MIEDLFPLSGEDVTPYEQQVTPSGTAFIPVASAESSPGTDDKLADIGLVYGLGGYSQYSRVLLCMV